MKNSIPKKRVLLVTFFLFFLNITFAINYVVSKAGKTEYNGTYVETEPQNGKPYYVYSSGGSTYAIGWDGSQWQLGIEVFGMIFESYTNTSTSSVCPTTGWEMGAATPPIPTVEMEGRALAYSTALFTENVATNDGSISNSIVITFNGYGGDAFTGSINDNFITGSKVTVSNVPAGLTASMIKTAANQLTFSFTGNATNHAQADRVYNITVTFKDAAFDQGNASGVSTYTKSDIGILYKITFSGGAGTEGDPYLISNKTDLRVLSENWSGVLWDKQYKQTADISFQETDFQSGGDFYNGGEGWIPIGTTATSFTGAYNGDGYTISNLFINSTANNYQGLFGYVDNSSTIINNLGVLNVNITGGRWIGGLVGGLLYGSISNSYSTGNITGSVMVGGLVGEFGGGSISNCYSTVNVTGTGYSTGGLVGTSNSPGNTISNSYSTGNVTGISSVGGLVGQNYATVSNCYSTGNVTRSSGTDTEFGGFIGMHDQGTITNSYSTGWVKYTGDANPTDKGFAGAVRIGTFSSCFWDTQTSAQATTAGTATGKTTTLMKTQSTFTDAGWDFVPTPVWHITYENNGYPHLAWQIIESTYTWNGSSSPVWNTNSNWNSNTVPTATDNVIIPDVTTDPIIGAASVFTEACKNLTIESGGVLTISAGKSLTVNGNLVNAADSTGLRINSDADGTGSLKVLGSISGSASIQRYMALDRWYLLSSPTATQTISDFIAKNVDIPVISNATNTFGMRDYSTSDKSEWNPYFTTAYLTTNSTQEMRVGKGYLVRTVTSATPFKLRFQGTLNPTGSKEISVSRTGDNGWNCIGNPYTSAIKIYDGTETIETDNFVNVNDGNFDPAFYGAYFWNDASGQKKYDIINKASGETFAQVGQGFFIKKIADAGITSMSVTPAMQFHQGAVALKSGIVSHPTIQLIATSDDLKSSTDIKFIDGTSKGLDVGYDAGILKADPSFALYTKLVEPFDADFQLQCLPTNQYNNMVIPIGIDSKAAGEIVFTVETVQLKAGCKVILEDKLTNTFSDLSKGSYKTSVVANTSTSERFYLHTGDIISGLEDQSLVDGKLTAYAKGIKEIRVIGEVGEGAVATLVNGLGQVVLTKKLGAGNLNIIGLPYLNSGLYMLNINDKGMPQTIKVMVRK